MLRTNIRMYSEQVHNTFDIIKRVHCIHNHLSLSPCSQGYGRSRYMGHELDALRMKMEVSASVT